MIKEINLETERRYITRLVLKSRDGVVCGPYGRESETATNIPNNPNTPAFTTIAYDGYHLSHLSGYLWNYFGQVDVVNALKFHWVQDEQGIFSISSFAYTVY